MCMIDAATRIEFRLILRRRTLKHEHAKKGRKLVYFMSPAEFFTSAGLFRAKISEYRCLKGDDAIKAAWLFIGQRLIKHYK